MNKSFRIASALVLSSVAGAALAGPAGAAGKKSVCYKPAHPHTRVWCGSENKRWRYRPTGQRRIVLYNYKVRTTYATGPTGGGGGNGGGKGGRP
ncbi:MAG TPA: hypothetical protein ENJ99_06830 [Rhizobiales bacterium]|nr:hypothetical protein [Hyphomicrobiales bacterium]